jgi:ubiquitin-like protein ATG12
MADDAKVVVEFRSAGEAPLLKNKKYKVLRTNSFAEVQMQVRKQLKIEVSDPMYFYCGTAFRPNPNDNLGDLYDCFQTGGTLIVHYCPKEAWG